MSELKLQGGKDCRGMGYVHRLQEPWLRRGVDLYIRANVGDYCRRTVIAEEGMMDRLTT